MIHAVFFKESRGLTGFKISGHAGYADSGQDIACASVSSAVMLTANTATEIFGITADLSAEDNTINFKLDNASEHYDDGIKLIRGLKLHLEEISHEFRGTIKINTTEV